jgi:hypothetical protein
MESPEHSDIIYEKVSGFQAHKIDSDSRFVQLLSAVRCLVAFCTWILSTIHKMGLTDKTDRYLAFFYTLILSCLFLFASVFLILLFRGWPNFVGLVIAFNNAIFPEILHLGVAKVRRLQV